MGEADWRTDAFELWCWRRLLRVPWSARWSVLNIHWKDWCWSWNSSTLATWCKELTHLKRPWTGRDWRWEKKGVTEDEMAGWHHGLDGCESEWTPEDGDEQGVLECCDSWGRKESDTTERLKWTELNCGTLVWHWDQCNHGLIKRVRKCFLPFRFFGRVWKDWC